MFESAGHERDCGNGEQGMPWEPFVKSLQKDVKKLFQKLEVAEKFMQRLEKSNQKTNEIQVLQISLMQRVSELETASAETAQQLPPFATSAQLFEFNPLRTVSHAYISEVSTKDVRAQPDLPEGFAEHQEKIDCFAEQQQETALRLSTWEQRFSKFEQRLSNVEELTRQRPKLAQHVTEADDLTTTIGNLECSESSLTELSQLSKKVHLLEQSVTELQGSKQVPEQASDQKESLISQLSKKSTTPREATIRGMQYKWRSSIWDTAVFIFSEKMNLGESIVVVACLVLSLTLLLSFTLEVQVLIRDKYARFDETSQQEYYLWRTTVAHDLNYRNRFTDASLASTICNHKRYASTSSLQLQTAQDLEDYLRENNFLSIPAGQAMALPCLCVWYLALVEEIRIIFDLLGATSSLEIGPQTTFEQDKDSDNTFHIVTVSYLRIFCIGFMMLLRLVIVYVLGWQGTLFVLSEVDLESMILNCVALQMMLTFDDFVFHVVPVVPQAVVDHMKPLKISSRKCPKCWHQWGCAIFLLGCAATALILAHVFYTIPFVEDVKNSYEALCGGVEGSYDFVVAVDAIGIPWAAATTPISDNMQEAYAQRAIATAMTSSFQSRPLQSSQRFNLGLFMQVASSLELEHAVSNLPEFNDPTEWSLIHPVENADVVGWKNELLEVLGQQDFADEPDTVYNHYLQHLLKQTGNVSCAQVPVSSCTKHGRRAEDVVMRKLCPTHCGCASPTEGTVANTYGSSSRSDFTGCAVWNTRKKAFIDRLRDLPCADTQSLDDFTSWSRGIGHAVMNDHLVSTFDSGKCPHVAKIDFSGLRICQETSLPSICPESCGCNTSREWTSVQTSRYDFCPYSCRSSQPPCITVVVTHAQDPGPRGPHAGFSCIFPFKYQGVTYHSCTSKDWSGPWCAVTLLDGVSHFWGDCPDASACINRST